MHETDAAPRGQFSKSKRTKMLVTLGPATDSYESILELLKAGANGFRLNFSHATYEQAKKHIKWINKARDESGKPAAIVLDTHGPKMQLGECGQIKLTKGQEIRFKLDANYDTSGLIPSRYDLSKHVKRGEPLLIADGRIRTEVTSVKNGVVNARVISGGEITSGKGINLPDTDFGGEVITARDRKDIQFGAENDIDYVAVSYVQTAKDIVKVQKIIKNAGGSAKIIAKIETKAAIEHLEEIIKVSDGVMVARGDLAVETLPESVPILQRKIIGLAQEHNTISIVATQMLASMTDSPDPTRAEVSDVATATIVGADCVMLSDETAIGSYPIEAVKTMKRIILYTQENAPLRPVFIREEDHSTAAAISSAITTLAYQVGAVAIVAETATGKTAISISARRPNKPIIIISDSRRVVMQMTLLYGGKAYLRPAEQKAATKLTNWLRDKHSLKKGDIIVSASGQHPGVTGGTDTIKVRALE